MYRNGAIDPRGFPGLPLLSLLHPASGGATPLSPPLARSPSLGYDPREVRAPDDKSAAGSRVAGPPDSDRPLPAAGWAAGSNLGPPPRHRRRTPMRRRCPGAPPPPAACCRHSHHLARPPGPHLGCPGLEACGPGWIDGWARPSSSSRRRWPAGD
jgi:hypothetical protein